MQRNEVGFAQKIIELIDQLDLQTARARRREIWIVSEHAHAEGDGAPAEFAADAAHADNA